MKIPLQVNSMLVMADRHSPWNSDPHL